MPTEMNPCPEIPRRPELTREALTFLETGSSSNVASVNWLAEMRTWLVWADGYRERLGGWYVEHQAVAHDRKVDPADLGPEPLYYRTSEQCKVCAYLSDQYQTHTL